MTQNASTLDPQRSHPISKTALWVAAGRAIGAREPDPDTRNPDFLAEPLLGDPAQLDLDHPVVDALGQPYEAAMQEAEIAGLVRAMTIRTRFIDDALRRAIEAGATQVLIPGAGLDSHAYRCQSLLAHARIFEVDRPATLAFKQQRVGAAVGPPPPNVIYVPIDVDREALPAALARHGYDASQRTFVLMEGLTMYLTEPALQALLSFCAAHATGTTVVFDFATHYMIEGMKRLDLANIPPVARRSFERFLNMIKDEPWLYGIPLDREKELLAEHGLELRELLTVGDDDSIQRYLTRADGTIVGANGHAKAEALREASQRAMGERLDPEQRQKIEAAFREQQRQSAYRIAEAAVA